MAITAGMVKELREMTGAGMMDRQKRKRKQAELRLRGFAVWLWMEINARQWWK